MNARQIHNVTAVYDWRAVSKKEEGMRLVKKVTEGECSWARELVRGRRLMLQVSRGLHGVYGIYTT